MSIAPPLRRLGRPLAGLATVLLLVLSACGGPVSSDPSTSAISQPPDQTPGHWRLTGAFDPLYQPTDQASQVDQSNLTLEQPVVWVEIDVESEQVFATWCMSLARLEVYDTCKGGLIYDSAGPRRGSTAVVTGDDPYLWGTVHFAGSTPQATPVRLIGPAAACLTAEGRQDSLLDGVCQPAD
ncbi:MAG: hypothetical protein LBJ44_00280 [Propionibacteriaceae bacterium]|jgi:hypothetical protein|nr:hypothetical protein [Propionibacteriaceae bacterium]